MIWITVSDLHGDLGKYQKLFDYIFKTKPDVVFICGDVMPPFYKTSDNLFFDFIKSELNKLKVKLECDYPDIFVIMGNDDERIYENEFTLLEKDGLWKYIHNKKIDLGKYTIYGYNYVPPTPFLLKDWEKFDVSRFEEMGTVPPYNGRRTVLVSDYEMKYSTIKDDLDKLTESHENSVFLFHSPPYKTNLDRAALDGKFFEGVPLDLHIGSIAIQRFIEKKQPYITFHGHVHESTTITGEFYQKIGTSHSFQAAYDGQELAIIELSPDNPEKAKRILI